ncbi:MAG: tRNA pseudouridine(13) synthase TruD [Candidatus Woesearchaeota archaeon]
MYTLKQLPEDFVVKEVSNIPVKDNGKYLYFKLSKREENTLGAIKKLSQTLRLPEKNFGVAGNKDKKAVTEQICSVFGTTKERLLQVKLDTLTLKFLGYGDVPICLGDLEGNQFTIVVRNLEPKTKITSLHYCPNYFDEQRFSEHNVEIGRSLVKKDFKKAAELVDDYHGRDWLQEHPQDYVGALKKVTMRLLRMYVNAYQSYLWNETLVEYLKHNCKKVHEVDYSEGKLVFVDDADKFKDLKIPIVGFGGDDLIKDEESKSIIEGILRKEKITYSDFIIKQIPELTLEGEERAGFVEVKDLKIGKLEQDELNSGKQKVTLTFTLGKGSYATMCVRNLFS